jgi:hypothetical protein
MHTELRYQARIHAISNKPREKKKIPANSPHFFYYYLKKKQHMQYGNDIICKGKIKLVDAQ